MGRYFAHHNDSVMHPRCLVHTSLILLLPVGIPWYVYTICFSIHPVKHVEVVSSSGLSN